MRRQDPSRPRSFGLRLAVGAAALLCVQVGVYLLILDDTVGGVSLLRAVPRRDPSMTHDAQAVVLRSEAAARLWSAEAYQQRLSAWTEALDSARLPYHVVTEPALIGALARATVLVLPGAVCLGEPAREAVRGFLARGNGVVATGAVGARSGDCSWQGWDFLMQLTGVRRAEPTAPAGAVFASFRGGEFYDGAMPAGFRLELPHQEMVMVEGERPSAYASDWRLRPLGNGEPSTAGLAVHRELGVGRAVWLGFDEGGAGRRPAPQRTLEAYLGVCAAWAARQPIATIATWPGRRPAAGMVVVVAGGRQEGLSAVAGALRGAGVEGTYVASEGGPGVDPGWGGDLVMGGGDEPFAGLAPEVQRRRLTAAREALEATAARRVTGFLPPAGAADAATIRAVADAGLSYTVGEMSGLRATPELVEAPSPVLSVLPGRPVVRIYRVVADDQEVLARPEDPADSLLRDLDRVMGLGGLYQLTLHSDLAAGTGLLPTVRSVLDEASRRGVWLASGSDIARWWVAREGLRAAAKRLSPYRVQVDLSNRGQVHAHDVVVSVHLPYAPGRVALRSPVLRLALPRQTVERDVLRLTFGDVPPQSNQTYVISLDE